MKYAVLKSITIVLTLCISCSVIGAPQSVNYADRYAFAQAAFDSVVQQASLKDRFLAWLPGNRKEGTRAHELQQLRKATWALQEELLKENNSQRFFVLLEKYKAELKIAATLLGLGLLVGYTGKAFAERKESAKKAVTEKATDAAAWEAGSTKRVEAAKALKIQKTLAAIKIQKAFRTSRPELRRRYVQRTASKMAQASIDDAIARVAAGVHTSFPAL